MWIVIIFWPRNTDLVPLLRLFYKSHLTLYWVLISLAFIQQWKDLSKRKGKDIGISLCKIILQLISSKIEICQFERFITILYLYISSIRKMNDALNWTHQEIYFILKVKKIFNNFSFFDNNSLLPWEYFLLIEIYYTKRIKSCFEVIRFCMTTWKEEICS